MEDLRRATNTKLAESKAALEETAEGKVEQLRRLFDKLLGDTREAQAQECKVIVQDKLDESQRLQDKEFLEKLANAVRALDQKMTGDMQNFVDRSIKTHGDEIRNALGDA